MAKSCAIIQLIWPRAELTKEPQDVDASLADLFRAQPDMRCLLS